ncbi:MAG: cupin domain-containing protein [Ferruginibacter sp.]
MTTASTSQIFVEDKNIPWEKTEKGVKRKILGYNADLMIVKVKFKLHAVGSVHNHAHTQVSYIKSGSFKVTIDDEEKILSKGDSFFVPSNTMHGVVCMKAGVLIDAFNPMREEFMV